MKLFIVLNLFALTFLVACKEKTSATVSESAVYACPMKCEGEKVYAEPGKCPVCGMDLVAVDPAATATTYEMQMTTMPEAPASGQPVTISFMPRKAGDAATQVPLDEVHEKKIHVIVVSADLGWYNHIHPDFQPDGSYTVTETFPAAGEYIVFADYHPTGAGNQVQRRTINVSGEPKAKEVFQTESLTTQVDGYQVKLLPLSGRFLTNNMNHVSVEVTRDGKPVTNFESVMGAKGHLVIISGDGQQYLHVHPEEVDGQLDMHTSFDKAGLYRAFFQFQTNGNLHTSYFTIDVKEGKAGELDESGGHDHEHDGHDHGDGEHDHSH